MEINRVYLPTVGSTNTWAKEHAHEFNKEALTLITAGEQTAGRGRFKREWVSPADCNLYATYVFFCSDLKPEIGNLPQVLALAAYQALFPISNLVRIKWPNDLVVEKKKLAGILCEVTEVDSHYAVILGIGININMSKSDLERIDRPAISLMEIRGESLDQEEVSEAVHHQFFELLSIFLEQGFSPFLKSFRAALIHKKGDPIRFSNFKSVIEGVFLHIDVDGSLFLQLPDGSEKRFISGELV